MSGPTTYRISENVGILGSSVKQSIDIRKYYFDYKRWLDRGEKMLNVSDFSTSTTYMPGGWRTDYPFPVVDGSIPDTSPLWATGAVASNTTTSITVNSGTPGLGYVVSFVALTDKGRQKEIDIVVGVSVQTNPEIGVPPGTQPPSQPIPPPTVIIGAGGVLPAGTFGYVYIQNNTGAVFTVTLPPNPILGQTLTIKDILGNCSLYPITVSGGALLIEGQPTIMLMINYGWVQLTYSGTQWVQI